MKRSILSVLFALLLLVGLLAVSAGATEDTGTTETPHTDHCICGGNLTTDAAKANHECTTGNTWIPLTGENIVRGQGITVASNRETNSEYNMFDATSGCYYLAEDIALERIFEIRPGQNISLCLNGHKLSLSSSAGTKQSIFRVTGGVLSICDCAGGGSVESNWTGAAPIANILNSYADENGSVFNLYGGSLVAKDANTGNNSGLIQISNNKDYDYPSTFNMYGGSLSGGHGSNGGSVLMKDSNLAVFNMYGGTISGGVAKTAGGNIYCARGTLHIYDGIITGGTAQGTQGGNLYITGSDSGEKDANNKVIYDVPTVTLDGGQFTNGTAVTRGGNVYIYRGNLAVNGGTYTGGALTGTGYGKDLAAGAAEPISLSLNGKVTIGELGAYGNPGNTYAFNLGDDFTTDTPIVLTAGNLSKVIRGATYAQFKHFVCGKEGAELALLNSTTTGDIWLFDPAVNDYHCRCGENLDPVAAETIGHRSCLDIKWTSMTQATVEALAQGTGDSLNGDYYTLPSGNYRLDEDITITRALVIPADNKVNLDLNGHTITATGDANRAIGARGNILISDSAYDPADPSAKWGKIQGTNVNYGYAAIYISGTATASYLYGGELTADVANYTKSGPVGLSGKLYMAGGQITGVETTASGAALALNDSGQFYMYGGTMVTGKTTAYGAGIYINKSAHVFKIYNGTIRGCELAEGQVHAKRGGAIYQTNGAVRIEGGLIENCSGNDTGGGGGAIAYQGGTLAMSGGTIQNCSHNKAGGAIYVAPAKTLTMTGGTISGCTAGYGGSIGSVGGTLNISGGTLTGGTATSSGGGNLYLEKNDTNAGAINISGTAQILDGSATTTHGGNIRVIGGSLSITGGTVSGGFAFKQGGNIHTNTGGTISGGTVTLGATDETSGEGGGNIRSTGGTLTISGTATISKGNANTVGGNIYPLHFVMTGGTVTEGYSAAQGGNLYLASGGSIEISGGTLSKGSGSLGGNIGVYAESNDATVTISGGTISDGNARSGGGGNIYMFPKASGTKHAILTVTGGQILGGTSKSSNHGGSIFANTNTCVVIVGAENAETGPVISGGFADGGRGGNVYINGGSFTMYSGTISNGRDGAVNARNGGAVCVIGGTFAMHGGTIDGCRSSGDGGNIFTLNSNVTMTGGTVKDGYSTKGGGGNFYVTVDNSKEITMQILGGTITGGTTGKDGTVAKSGGNLRANSPYVTLVIGAEGTEGPTVSGGVATANGGNLYSAANPATIYSGTFTHGLDEGVANAQKGGGIYIGSGALDFRGGTVDGGISGATGGGGIYVNSGEFTLSGGTVRNCRATAGGGGVFVASEASFTMTGGTIENCQAVYGGNLYIYGGTADISGGTIRSGIATANTGAAGGNINVEKKDDTHVGTLNLSGTVLVTGGQATNSHGGNIYINRATMTMTGGTISNGVSSGHGGGVFVSEGATAAISDATLSGNKAVAADGADGDDGAAGSGGNLYAAGAITLTNCTISNGSATYRGGNIYASGAITMTGGSVTGGSAQPVEGAKVATNGGNITALGGGTFSGVTIADGQATHGGNLSVNSGTYTIENCTISNGDATLRCDDSTNGNGGNLYAIGGSTVTITGCSFNGGKAMRGGSIAAWGRVTIDNTTVDGGHAYFAGGNIMAYGSSTRLTLNDGTVLRNGSVTQKGAALYLSSGNRVHTISDGVEIHAGEAGDYAPCVYLDDTELNLIGAPAIDSIHVAAGIKNHGLIVDQMAEEARITLTATQPGMFGTGAEADLAHIVSAQGYALACRNGKLYLDAPTAVYVSDNGSDSNAGSQAAPYKTLNHALSMVADNGTVHIVDILTQATSGTGAGGWAEHGKTFTLTGGEFVTPKERIYLRDNVTFDNLILTMAMSTTSTSSNYGSFFFYCNGFTTVFEDDITTRYLFDGTYMDDSYQTLTYTPSGGTETEVLASCKLYGGANSAYGVIEGTNLTVLGGVWGEIYGGSNDQNITGDVHLTVGGNVNAGVDYVSHTHSGRHVIFGGSRSADIAGTVYMNVTGGQNHTSTFGGSSGNCSIGAVELRATGGNGMAIYGGGKYGVNTVGTINFYYEGATFEQVFGGSISQDLIVTDALNLYITGGTITRRLYGGCWVNREESLFGDWDPQKKVTGIINLYIGENANITCNLNKPSGDSYSDRSIYAHTRYPSNASEEQARLIFQSKAAYDKFKGLLKANDSAMSFLMGSMTAADYICYMGTTVDGYTITAGAIEVEDNVSNALDLPTVTATLNLEDSYTYKGEAVEPAYTLCGETTLPFAISYVNNSQPGTGRVTMTLNGETLVADFTIVDGKVATVNGTVYYYLQEALDAAGEMGLVVLVSDTQESAQVNTNLYLDLNGHSIAGTLTVAENMTLYGVDSATNDYDCSDGYGTIAKVNGTVALHHKTETKGALGRILRYLTYTDPETGAVSFHRIYLGITKVTIRPGKSGVGYKAIFGGDEIVKSMLDEENAFGYRLQLEGQETVTSRDGTREEFITGGEGTNVGLVVSNYDMEYADKKLTAWVTLTLADGTEITTDNEVITSSRYEYTFKDILKKVDEQIDLYSQEQLEGLKNMISSIADQLQEWGFTNLYDLVTATTDPATPAPSKEEI